MSSADYRVTLLLMARDQLSRSIASAKKAVKDFADTAQRESKKVQSTWSKMAGGLNDVLKITLGVGIAELAAQAARSLIGFVQDSIRAFADLELAILAAGVPASEVQLFRYNPEPLISYYPQPSIERITVVCGGKAIAHVDIP